MKIYLDMVGCRLNQSEIEAMANQLRYYGHQVTGDPGEADLAIINTCCVTAKASADSRKMIRHVGNSGAREIMVTGCWATMFPGEAVQLPKVKAIFSNDLKDNLVGELLRLQPEELILGGLPRDPLPGERHRTRAFIKVQDGCDAHCSYCLTRLARGRSRSVDLAVIGKNIEATQKGGTKEIVLTGVQLGAYGKDLEEKLSLCDLIKRVLQDYPGLRIRLSSIEPWDLSDELLGLWESPNLCRHLHIPMQSGSAKILKRMARRTTPEEFFDLVSKAQNLIPGIAITTDVILGFPGETEEDFEETIAMIRKLKLAGGHAFTFSAMAGTPAEKFAEQVSYTVKKLRNHICRQVFEECKEEFHKLFIGQNFSVLWESAKLWNGTKPGESAKRMESSKLLLEAKPGESGKLPESEKVGENAKQGKMGWELSGLTDNYIRVKAFSEKNLENEISLVRLDRIDPAGGWVYGEIIR